MFVNIQPPENNFETLSKVVERVQKDQAKMVKENENLKSQLNMSVSEQLKEINETKLHDCICSICFLSYRDKYIMNCCSFPLCSDCFDKVKKSTNSCPQCRSIDMTFIHDLEIYGQMDLIKNQLGKLNSVFNDDRKSGYMIVAKKSKMKDKRKRTGKVKINKTRGPMKVKKKERIMWKCRECGHTCINEATMYGHIFTKHIKVTFVK